MITGPKRKTGEGGDFVKGIDDVIVGIDNVYNHKYLRMVIDSNLLLKSRLIIHVQNLRIG